MTYETAEVLQLVALAFILEVPLHLGSIKDEFQPSGEVVLFELNATKMAEQFVLNLVTYCELSRMQITWI